MEKDITLDITNDTSSLGEPSNMLGEEHKDLFLRHVIIKVFILI